MRGLRPFPNLNYRISTIGNVWDADVVFRNSTSLLPGLTQNSAETILCLLLENIPESIV